MTNMNLNIDEAAKASPISCQVIPQVVFHSYAPDFSPNVLTDGTGWPDLTASARVAHAAHTLTDTAASSTATLADIRSVKINSNRARPTEDPAATPRLPANHYGDITLVISSGESDSNSDYVDSTRNSTAISAFRP